MEQFLAQNPWAIYAIYGLVAWSIPWKGIALWKSAKNGQKIWFVVLLLVNTFAILEIIYILLFSKSGDGENNTMRMSDENSSNGPTRIIIQ